MKKLLTLTFASAALLAFSAELKTWNFDSERDLMGDRIHAYAAKGAPSHAIQLNCIYCKPLETGRTYRLQFYCKGTAAGKIILLAAQGGAPYKTLSKKASKSLNVTTEWQLCSLEFTPELTAADSNYALPRMLLAGYPAGAELFFGPVMLSDETK